VFYIEHLIKMEMEEGKGGGRKGRRVVARSKPKSHKKVGDKLGVGSNNNNNWGP
jgi:hypothetical protein